MCWLSRTFTHRHISIEVKIVQEKERKRAKKKSSIAQIRVCRVLYITQSDFIFFLSKQSVRLTCVLCSYVRADMHTHIYTYTLCISPQFFSSFSFFLRVHSAQYMLTCAPVGNQPAKHCANEKRIVCGSSCAHIPLHMCTRFSCVG